MNSTLTRKAYLTDLSDARWELLSPLLKLPDGGKMLLAKAAKKGLPQLIKVLADDGYSGQPMREHVLKEHQWEFESVKRTELKKFVVQPKRSLSRPIETC